MKRVLIIILGLAATACGGRALAQQPTALTTEPAPTMTKVGVLNILQLYEKCNRVKDLKTRMENDIKPFAKKKEDLEKLITDWQAAFKNTKQPLTQAQKEQGAQVIKECQRRLQDLSFEFQKDVAKRFEQDTENLTKYINATIESYAKYRGFHLVLAYGDPETPLPVMIGFQRNIGALDKGYMRPVFFPGAVDITPDLLQVLNNIK